MKAIGIDIGTTSISAVVLEVSSPHPFDLKTFHENGACIVESRTLSNPGFLSAKNNWERIQDPSRIVETAKKLLDELLNKHPDVVSIGLTGQMHGILYVDDYGQAVSPLYTWQDLRAEKQGDSMVEHIFNRTGVSVSASYGLATHVCLHKNRELPKRAASLCTIADYLGMVLTGRPTPLLHTSMAASLGFFEVQQGTFDCKALELLGVDVGVLPRVTADIKMQGCYEGRPVAVAIGDNQASFLGAVGLQEGTVLINMGTGGQISVLARHYFCAPGLEARPLLSGNYLLVGASLCGGRAYAILEGFFRSYARALGLLDTEQYARMEQLAGLPLAGEPLQVRTTFGGTRANPHERGSILHLTEENFTPAHLVQGVIRGMATELYELFALMQQGTGIRACRLVASGNGLRKNVALQRAFAELFNATLRLSPYEEEAACGAAAVALEAFDA